MRREGPEQKEERKMKNKQTNKNAKWRWLIASSHHQNSEVGSSVLSSTRSKFHKTFFQPSGHTVYTSAVILPVPRRKASNIFIVR